MSNRGALFSGIGLGPAISFAEMDQAQASRQHLEMQQKEMQREQMNRENIRKQAAATYLSNALDKKDFLSGSPYDPMIVQGLDSAMKQGMELAAKGADTPSIMMAIGPLVGKLNQYQQTAKQVDANIKTSVEKRKQFSGYNADSLIDESKKAAFYNADGTLKDISQVDPNLDYTTQVLQNNPERVTTSAGIDDFVNKTPMGKSQQTLQTEYGGRKMRYDYNIEKPYWMGVAKDEQGNPLVDPKTKMPIGLDVKSTILRDRDGQPMLDENKQPFRVMDDNTFKSVMSRSPGVADFINGQVRQHFMDAGAKDVPPVGSPDWENMAKHILYQELKTRDRSDFKRKEIETKTAPLTKIELGIPVYAPKSGKGSAADVEINDAYKEVADDPEIERGDAKLLSKFGGSSPAIIVDQAKKRGYKDVTQDDLYVHKDTDGVIKVYDRPTGKVLFPFDQKGVNLSANKTVKTSQKVLEEQNEPKYEVGGKKYSEAQLQKGAAHYKMSLEQYKKELGIK